MVFLVFRCYSVILFMFSLFLGVVMSLCSVSMFSIWVGMEVSFLGVIGMMSGDSSSEVESTMKYFIVQVLGSMFFLLGVVLMSGMIFLGSEMVFMVLGLCIKIGLFPFHFWVPAVMCQMSWWGCVVVAVFQKIVPVWVLSNLMLDGFFLSVVEIAVMLTGLVGCLGGLGVLHFRVLLAYSSLVHSGFMTIMSLVSFFYVSIYLLIYLVLNLGLVISMWLVGAYSVMDVLKPKSAYSNSLMAGVSLFSLSLAGLPPFTGCFLKVFYLIVCWNKFPLVSVLLLFSSGVSLYYYVNLFFYLSIWNTSGSVSSFFMGGFGNSNFLSVSIILNLFLGWPLFLLSGIL